MNDEGFEDPVEQEARRDALKADAAAVLQLTREAMFGVGYDPLARNLPLPAGAVTRPGPAGRDSGGRFAAGNPGRPRGSRNRAASRLAGALLDDFAANELETIARLRLYYFPDYVRLLGRFLPRAGSEALRPDFASYAPAETAAVVAAAREALAAVERGEAGLDALLAVLERDPATVNYGESTVANGEAPPEPRPGAPKARLTSSASL
jgi:hypothetical protein